MKYGSTGLQGAFLRIKSVISNRRSSRGFSLLEALTALAVLSITMSAVMNNYTTGMRAADRSEKRIEATVLARNLLAEAKGNEQVSVGRRTGRVGSLIWQIDTALLEKGKRSPQQQGPVWNLYNVRIVIKNGKATQAALETLKAGKAGDQKR